jgi:hypothetical protein
LATALLLVAASAIPGRADETFLCADGSSVTIDSANRAAMQDHPCVKAWFANELARRQAQAGEQEGARGSGQAPAAVRRYTGRGGGAAARELQSRPGYLAWSRMRNVRPHTSKYEGSAQTRPGFRLRLGRR